MSWTKDLAESIVYNHLTDGPDEEDPALTKEWIEAIESLIQEFIPPVATTLGNEDCCGDCKCKDALVALNKLCVRPAEKKIIKEALS